MQRHIISMKSEGFLQTPQDIMEEYNGCSVPLYTAYPCDKPLTRGCRKGMDSVGPRIIPNSK